MRPLAALFVTAALTISSAQAASALESESLLGDPLADVRLRDVDRSLPASLARKPATKVERGAAIDGTTLPATGYVNPGYAALDQAMRDFMIEKGIGAGVLGVMKNGVVVVARGYGTSDEAHEHALPADAMFRLASVTKPWTAAAIRHLEHDGLLDLDQFAFNLGQPGGGILSIPPWPSLGDERLKQVTVRHLLGHTAGWDRYRNGTTGELFVYKDLSIAAAMGVQSPPGRYNDMRYVLGQPLVHDPGSTWAYSNEGYLALSFIVEQLSGVSWMDYVRANVLAPLGVGTADLLPGRTFAVDRSPREPWYDFPYSTRNVFYPFVGPEYVRWPDGGWEQESFVGVGDLVGSTLPILAFLDSYRIYNEWSPDFPGIGGFRTGFEDVHWRSDHTGGLAGADTLARQRGDGVNYVVLFNQSSGSSISYAAQIKRILDKLLDPPGDACPQASCPTVGPEEILVTDLDTPDGSGALIRIDPVTGYQSIVSSGGYLFTPVGVAASHDGKIFVSDAGAGIVSVDPETGSQSSFLPIGMLVFPNGIALDAQGDLIVADAAATVPNGTPSKLVRVDAQTAVPTILCEIGSTGYLSIALDAQGRALLVDFGDYTLPGDGGLLRVDLTTCAKEVVSQGGALLYPAGLAVDPSTGAILVSDLSGALIKVNPETGVQTVLCSGLDGSPIALGIRARGQIFSVGTQRGPVAHSCGATLSDFGLLTRPWAMTVRFIPEPAATLQFTAGVALLLLLARRRQRQH